MTVTAASTVCKKVFLYLEASFEVVDDLAQKWLL